MDRRIFPRRFVGLSLIGLALCSAPSWAADDNWTEAGFPSGGTVNKVVIDPSSPSTLYAISDPGVFESNDGGTSWSLILPLSDQITDIAIDPITPTTLYVTSVNDGLYMTSDGGATWTTAGIDSGLPLLPAGIFVNPTFQDFTRVTVDPVNDGTAYVFTDSSGIYKTTDGGVTWNAINDGLSAILGDDLFILSRLLVDPANPQVLYLAVSKDTSSDSPTTTSGGLYTSVDGGAHWTMTSLADVSVRDIDFDPADPTRILGISCSAYGSEFFSVTNSGANVSSATLGICPNRLRVDPANNQHLYAGAYPDGLYVSNDGGNTWLNQPAISAWRVQDIAIDPVTPSNVYVSTTSWGIYRSSDTGSTWALSNTGISAVATNALSIGSDGSIYIGSSGTGILRSSDGGADWSAANNGFTLSFGYISVLSLSQETATPGTLYAATDNGLYQTTDGGDDWTQLNNGLTDPQIDAVAIDPEVGSTVFAGTQSSGLFMSTDGGATWTAASTGLPSDPIEAITVDPTDSHIVFVGTLNDGLYISTDGAASFNPDNAGVIPDGWINAIAVDPTDHDNVYVATGFGPGVYKSTDGGASWSLSSSGLGENIFTAILIDPADASTIFLVPWYGNITGTPVYFSTDAGADWMPLSAATPLQQVSRQGVKRANARPVGQATLASPFNMKRGSVLSAQNKTASTTTTGSVQIVALVANPSDPTQLLGVGSDHRFYVLDFVPPSGSSGGGSGTGGSSGGGTTSGGGVTTGGGTTTVGGHPVQQHAAGSGGGGNVSLITGLLLLGLALRRRLS